MSKDKKKTFCVLPNEQPFRPSSVVTVNFVQLDKLLDSNQQVNRSESVANFPLDPTKFSHSVLSSFVPASVSLTLALSRSSVPLSILCLNICPTKQNFQFLFCNPFLPLPTHPQSLSPLTPPGDRRSRHVTLTSGSNFRFAALTRTSTPSSRPTSSCTRMARAAGFRWVGRPRLHGP